MDYDGDEYEGEFDLEDAGYPAESEHDEDVFDKEYERIFAEGTHTSEDDAFERDAITGRRAKRPRLAVLNKTKVTKQELDELFLN